MQFSRGARTTAAVSVVLLAIGASRVFAQAEVKADTLAGKDTTVAVTVRKAAADTVLLGADTSKVAQPTPSDTSAARRDTSAAAGPDSAEKITSEKGLSVEILSDGTFTVKNYTMRNGEARSLSVEFNLEIMEKLGAKGDEKMEGSRRVTRKDGEFVRIRTYVKFRGIESLLVLVDRGTEGGTSTFELDVAPASSWPKEEPARK